MTALAWLIPCALLLGLAGLATFMWALRSNQFDDLDGAAWRAIDASADEPPEINKSLTRETDNVDR